MLVSEEPFRKAKGLQKENAKIHTYNHCAAITLLSSQPNQLKLTGNLIPINASLVAQR